MNPESSKSLTPPLLDPISGNVHSEVNTEANTSTSAQVLLLKALIVGIGEARDLTDAFGRVLQTVCQQQRWQYGEVWRRGAETDALYKYQDWSHKPRKSFAPDAGFPERIWVSQQAEWYADITDLPEPLFHRQAEAAVCDIRAASGIPLVAKKQTLAVLTFFSDVAVPDNPQLVESLDAISGVIAQLAQQQQAQTALQNSEARFQAFMNHSPAVVFIKDQAGHYAYLNRPFEKAFNLEKDALVGKSDTDYLPEKVAQQVRENDRRVLLKNKEEVVVESVPTPDGVDRYWQVLKFPFTDPTGQQFVGGVAIDITQQKQFEERLVEEQQITKATLKSIDDAVITTNAAGLVQYLNPVAEQLTGWTQAAAYNQPISQVFQIIHQATYQPADNPVEQALRDRQAVRLDGYTTLVARGGHRLSIENSAAPIQTDSGQLIGAVMVFRDVSTMRQLTQQLSWQTTHDILTGLLNRREFELRLRQAVDNARTHRKVHALCYFDLDNFKIINDTCGHAAGDELLKQVSTLLVAHIRMTDTLARLGGDEFGLLLEYCQIDQAQRIVHKLREKLKALRFVYAGRAFSVAVSIGITTITADTQNAETALTDADAACYAAKRKGRNRTQLYRTNDFDLAQQRGEIQWAAYIAEALEAEALEAEALEAEASETSKFQLYQQPILSLSPACPEGEHYEVLLRLQDQAGRLVSPGVFMPAAERYDLMPQIDRWVVSTLFATQASYYQQVWHRSQTQPDAGSHLYSVNLSGASINDDDFIHFLREQFEKYNIPPSLICFEVTETAAITNLEKAAQFITEMRSLGCQFALDDFGSGMSSFTYLKMLPIDYLKIDGHFIQNIVDNEVDMAMVTAIHQIAQVMNIQTVAEFVEDDATLQTVRALGIGYAQGYGIARPKPLLVSS